MQDPTFHVEQVRKELERLVLSNANLRNQLEGILNNSADGIPSLFFSSVLSSRTVTEPSLTFQIRLISVLKKDLTLLINLSTQSFIF